LSIKAFVYGRDGTGWSIDADRHYTEQLLREAGIEVTRNPLKSDVVHLVWWNQALRLRKLKHLSSAKWLAVVTNTIRDDSAEYGRLSPVIDCWVAANRAQYDWFQEQNSPCAYQPFYVDERVFHPIALLREQICTYLGIDYQLVGGKTLIGSFQRDSLGADLSQPKWQKGPDTLVKILQNTSIPRDQWCLIVAGPRRHWLIKQCEELGIPYVFVGEMPKSGQDDVQINTLSREQMALLYNLVDIYIVSSKMEGGPKAIMEAALCQTPVISTKVGLAPDMLVKGSLYDGVDVGTALLEQLLGNKDSRDMLSQDNYKKTIRISNRQASVARWKSIYEKL
jgi:glycosyltransferase involved in cell wall biosynthesis